MIIETQRPPIGACLLLLCGMALAQPSSVSAARADIVHKNPGTGTQLEKDLLVGLSHARERGLLSDELQWELMARALLRPETLPIEWRGYQLPAMRCRTPLLHSIWPQRELLELATRTELEILVGGGARSGYSTPVPTVGYVASERFPLKVHYRLEGQLEQAIRVLELAEASWEVEIGVLGLSAPLPDGSSGGDDALDLYLTTYANSGGGAYTIPSYRDANGADDRRSCSSYILLYEEISDALMPVYVAHELSHASQAATDFEELPWAWEATATFLEDVVFDQVNDYYGYIPGFQQYPQQHLALFSSNASYRLYPYGSSIFMHFLNEDLFQDDPSWVALLWESSVQAGTENEPDLLDSVDRLARARGWDGLDEVYARFALWRFMVGTNDDGEHFSEGAAWAYAGDVIPPVDFQVGEAQLPAKGTVQGLAELGTAYVLYSPPAGSHSVDLRISASVVQGNPSRLGIVASGIRLGETSLDEVVVLNQQTGSLRGDVSFQGVDSVVVGFLNLGASDYDADPEAATVSLEFKLEPAGGCGCDASSSPSGQRRSTGLLALILPLVWLEGKRRERGHPAPQSSTSST